MTQPGSQRATTRSLVALPGVSYNLWLVQAAGLHLGSDLRNIGERTSLHRGQKRLRRQPEHCVKQSVLAPPDNDQPGPKGP